MKDVRPVGQEQTNQEEEEEEAEPNIQVWPEEKKNN